VYISKYRHLSRSTETPSAPLADLRSLAVENNTRLGYKVNVELERWPNEAEMVAELYGGAWSNRENWARRCRPEGCIVCTSGHPYGIIADLKRTWVTTDPEVAIFGYVCVISKVHAVEPFDLPDQGAAFWQEAMAVAQVVNRLYRPMKLNYQIHGNTLPHLHMHLFPRQPDDGFVGRPVDLKDFHHRYSDRELAELRSALALIIPTV
jgi:diadenosine tetraphosphate (Ap4A) HIT family hydrolase